MKFNSILYIEKKHFAVCSIKKLCFERRDATLRISYSWRPNVLINDYVETRRELHYN